MRCAERSSGMFGKIVGESDMASEPAFANSICRECKSCRKVVRYRGLMWI